MNEQILFDRLRYMDRLKTAGIPEAQARAHADAMDDALRESVATKSDLARLEAATRSDFAAIDLKFAKLEARIDMLSRDLMGTAAFWQVSLRSCKRRSRVIIKLRR